MNGVGVAVGDSEAMLHEVEVDLKRSVAVRDRRGRQAARRDVQRHLPPVIQRRREREADLADDLGPQVQRRDRGLPVTPRELRPERAAGRRLEVQARSGSVSLACRSGSSAGRGRPVPRATPRRRASCRPRGGRGWRPRIWLTSSYDQRSNANSIDSRSRSRNSGLTWVSKLRGSSALAFTIAPFLSVRKPLHEI